MTTTTNGESLLGERSCKTKKKEGEVKGKTAQGLLRVRACAFERTKVSREGETEKERRKRRQDGGRAKDNHVKIEGKEEHSNRHAHRKEREKEKAYTKVSFPPGKELLTRTQKSDALQINF